MTVDIVGQVLTPTHGGNLGLDVEKAQAEDKFVLRANIENALKGPGSLWPVRSGKSKRAFRVTATTRFFRVKNRYRYAYIVEARYRKREGVGPAAETIARALASTRGRGSRAGRGFARGFASGLLEGAVRQIGGPGARAFYQFRRAKRRRAGYRAYQRYRARQG